MGQIHLMEWRSLRTSLVSKMEDKVFPTYTFFLHNNENDKVSNSDVITSKHLFALPPSAKG